MTISNIEAQRYMGEIFEGGGLSEVSRTNLDESSAISEPKDGIQAQKILEIADIASQMIDLDLRMSQGVIPRRLAPALQLANQEITMLNTLRGTPLARDARIHILVERIQHVQKYIKFTYNHNLALAEIATQLSHGILSPALNLLANRQANLDQIYAEADSNNWTRVRAQVAGLRNQVIELRHTFADLVEKRVREIFTQVVEHPEDGLNKLLMRGLVTRVQDLKEEGGLAFRSDQLDLDLFSICFEKVRVELLEKHFEKGQLIGRVFDWSERISE